MKKQRKSMMGVACPTGSHLPVLEEAAISVGDGLIIEHGAGLYSTPLLARLGCRVICVEGHPGWAEWAAWIYQSDEVVKPSGAEALLADAALVFIDGPAAERGPLLQACIAKRVPIIIAHDTNERDWRTYRMQSNIFSVPGYEVTHSAEDSHRTTKWVLK